MTPSERLAAIATFYGARVTRGGTQAYIRCPIHGGQTANLSLTVKVDVLYANCLAYQCDFKAINAALEQETGVRLWERRDPNTRPAALSPEQRRTIEERRARVRRLEEECAQRAAQEAERLVFASDTLYKPHAYLKAKGFPNEQGLVAPSGELLVPMRNYKTGAIQSIQFISADGEKKFLPGGRTGEAVHRVGRGRERFYCEGLATALAIRDALRTLYREAEAWVCFSAANMLKVAQSKRRAWVVADHDYARCRERECRWRGEYKGATCPLCGNESMVPPAGQTYAARTGLPFWMPETIGEDAADVFLHQGVRVLAGHLRELMGRER